MSTKTASTPSFDASWIARARLDDLSARLKVEGAYGFAKLPLSAMRQFAQLVRTVKDSEIAYNGDDLCPAKIDGVIAEVEAKNNAEVDAAHAASANEPNDAPAPAAQPEPVKAEAPVAATVEPVPVAPGAKASAELLVSSLRAGNARGVTAALAALGSLLVDGEWGNAGQIVIDAFTAGKAPRKAAEPKPAKATREPAAAGKPTAKMVARFQALIDITPAGADGVRSATPELLRKAGCPDSWGKFAGTFAPGTTAHAAAASLGYVPRSRGGKDAPRVDLVPITP